GALPHADDPAHFGEASLRMGIGGRARPPERGLVAPSSATVAAAVEGRDSALQGLHEPRRLAVAGSEGAGRRRQSGNFLRPGESASHSPIRRTRRVSMGESMTNTTVFMFSGQGSQYFHMGRALYDGDDTFREWMIELDDIARVESGRSVIETLYSDECGKGDPFDRTLLTHPAIFMVEYSLAQSLMRAGVRPDVVLGVSLGSFAAAAVAGFIGVEDALTAVMRQATALEECCEPGGMIAVLADPALFAEDFLSGRGELAAVHFSSHFVVSARRAEIEAVPCRLRKRSIGYQRLPVSVPFHSQWIDDATS